PSCNEPRGGMRGALAVQGYDTFYCVIPAALFAPGFIAKHRNTVSFGALRLASIEGVKGVQWNPVCLLKRQCCREMDGIGRHQLSRTACLCVVKPSQVPRDNH